MDTSRLKRAIMMRIYWIWLIRRVGPVVVFEVLFLILALHLFAGSVFVLRIAQNASDVWNGGFFGILNFFITALINTRLQVKAEIIAALAMGALLLWSLKRAIVSYELIRRGTFKK